MKSVALIHTVKTLATSFDDRLKSYIDEEIKVHNLLDDFLANNPNEIGVFTKENYNRLYNDIKTQELTGADIIVVTCSTLTPIVELIRPFIKVPLIAIDDQMSKEAVKRGDKILILATAISTKEPLTKKLIGDANKINKNVSVDFMVNSEAFEAMKAVNMKLHDELLLSVAKDIKGYDCVVLAQASMAHLDKKIEEVCGVPVLSSTSLCLEQIKLTLRGVK